MLEDFFNDLLILIKPMIFILPWHFGQATLVIWQQAPTLL